MACGGDFEENAEKRGGDKRGGREEGRRGEMSAD